MKSEKCLKIEKRDQKNFAFERISEGLQISLHDCLAMRRLRLFLQS